MKSLRRLSQRLALVALGCAAGCWQGGGGREPLKIDRTSPTLGDPDRPVLLNDSITVYFSEPILPLSVTPDSVTVLDDQGHQVPGDLRIGDNWVAFVPEPPLAADLGDGSFRPGAHYGLMIAGYPRHDAVRARDGRWLVAAETFDVYAASIEQRPAGLPSLLRPPSSAVPFVLRTTDVPMQVAADAPRLQLHFTQPVLPTSVRVEAFEIRVLRSSLDVLRPRSVRVVSTSLDNLPGSTVEIDLGSLPQNAAGEQLPLTEADLISVAVLADGGLTDYAGNPPLPTPAMGWTVVSGTSVPLCEWPSDEHGYVAEDALLPGFEVAGSTIRPRVRVEAGNGSLGVFRPSNDVELRPGQPFDRGDGTLVQSIGGDFPFLAVDVPSGVRVTLDASAGPVRLLACGSVRIAGELVLRAAPVPMPGSRFATWPVRSLLAEAPVAVLAAGDVHVEGALTVERQASEGETQLLLAAAGRMSLRGTLPVNTLLVVDAAVVGGDALIEGPRGQSRAWSATFTRGLAAGADFEVRGVLPWRCLPSYEDHGLLRLVDSEPMGVFEVAWQATSPDALSRGPDLSPGHTTRWQQARDGDLLTVGLGGFVRLSLACRVRADTPLARLRAVRIDER
ncbi:MAG: hypothetical protein H6835_07330 [Planctomycetes bacterium]|nr:hypothetical protein [Planctomycetota bacterium]